MMYSHSSSFLRISFTNFKLKNLSFFETEIDYIKKWSPYRLFIYYSFLYQFKPNIICNEGVALKFFSRSEAKNLNIPLNVLKIWDRMNARLFNDQENPSNFQRCNLF